jgi:hypothetical protein
MSRRSSKAQVNKVKAPPQLPSFDRLCSVAPPVHCALLLPSVSVHSMVLALHIYEYTYAIFFCFSFCSVGWLIQPRFTLYVLNTISCTMDHRCWNHTCCLSPCWFLLKVLYAVQIVPLLIWDVIWFTQICNIYLQYSAYPRLAPIDDVCMSYDASAECYPLLLHAPNSRSPYFFWN